MGAHGRDPHYLPQRPEGPSKGEGGWQLDSYGTEATGTMPAALLACLGPLPRLAHDSPRHSYPPDNEPTQLRLPHARSNSGSYSRAAAVPELLLPRSVCPPQRMLSAVHSPLHLFTSKAGIFGGTFLLLNLLQILPLSEILEQG